MKLLDLLVPNMLTPLVLVLDLFLKLTDWSSQTLITGAPLSASLRILKHVSPSQLKLAPFTAKSSRHAKKPAQEMNATKQSLKSTMAAMVVTVVTVVTVVSSLLTFAPSAALPSTISTILSARVTKAAGEKKSHRFIGPSAHLEKTTASPTWKSTGTHVETKSPPSDALAQRK